MMIGIVIRGKLKPNLIMGLNYSFVIRKLKNNYGWSTSTHEPIAPNSPALFSVVHELFSNINYTCDHAIKDPPAISEPLKEVHDGREICVVFVGRSSR